jgi:hypothetical protein
MEPIKINESNYQAYTNLDIVAFSFARGGAMGDPGGIDIIDKAGQSYYMNYCYGANAIKSEHVKDIIPVFNDMGFSLLGSESNNDNWVSIYLGFGNSLFLIKDLYDAFMKKAEEAHCHQSHELYRHWHGFVQELLRDEMVDG